LEEDLHGLPNEEIRKLKITGMVCAVRSENPEEWLQSNTYQLGFHHNALTQPASNATKQNPPH